MANYIELQTAIDFIKNNTPTIDGMTTLGCVERSLYNAPNADVVPVVRCKDCKHNNMNGGDCNRTMTLYRRDPTLELNISEYIKLEHCSYGERREGE